MKDNSLMGIVELLLYASMVSVVRERQCIALDIARVVP